MLYLEKKMYEEKEKRCTQIFNEKFAVSNAVYYEKVRKDAQIK